MPPQIRVRCLSCIALTILLVSCVVTTRAEYSHSFNKARSNSATNTNLLVTLNLRDFGATGNGTTNDGPALQNALNALADAGGGTLFVPAGRYAITTSVFKDFTGLAQSVTIQGVESSTAVPPPTSTGEELSQGLDLVSEFYPRTGTQKALNIKGLQSFLIKDIAFVGTPGILSDAGVTLNIDHVEEAIVSHCEFYGLRTGDGGGAIVMAIASRLAIERTVFLGCTANSADNTPVVQNLSWKSITVTEAIFIDFGQRPELFTKTNLSAPLSWINVSNAAAPDHNFPRRQVTIKSVFLDEGALFGITALPNPFQVTSAPIDLLYVTGLFMNVSNLNAAGHHLTDLKGLLVENAHYGFSRRADTAINIVNIDNAILDRLECVDAANRIRADDDTGRLTVIHSIFNDLLSEAQITTVIPAGEDDPVQEVRTRFNETLGREPDPAAHFFWSDKLLQCNNNTQCETARRTELSNYLASNPQPDFSINGRVLSNNGAGVPGVTITLAGSQTVDTQTDSQGRYSFLNLPTSGVYTVTATLGQSTFTPSSFEIVTPAGDQILESRTSGGGTGATVEFASASLSTTEGAGVFQVLVTRSGNNSEEATIRYSVVDGTAHQGDDLNTVIGQLTFAPGVVTQTISLLITDDAFVEGSENLSVTLSDPDGAVLGSRSSVTVTITDNDSSETDANPIDDALFFVRQQYRDFLNREPDAAGLNFWANQIIACGTNTSCLISKRQNVSAAFFLSIEFQETGFLTHRMYKAAYGRAPRHVEEFLFDTRLLGKNLIVGIPGWEQLLEANKVNFLNQFVQRPEFIVRYPLTLTPSQFVEALNVNTGLSLTPSEVAAAIAEFGGAANISDTAARRRAIRKVAENSTFVERETPPAFVRMQYFGYLQRNPDDPPDSNLDGYNFWLDKLIEFNGNWEQAEMVRAFIESIEYRSRFGR